MMHEPWGHFRREPSQRVTRESDGHAEGHERCEERAQEERAHASKGCWSQGRGEHSRLGAKAPRQKGTAL